MKTKINALQYKQLRRKAKKLSKKSGIQYMVALDTIAKGEGFPSWKKLVHKSTSENKAEIAPKKPKSPVPVAIDYHDVWHGTVMGQRPNAKMSVKRHSKVGEVLKELLFETEYHKRAKKTIQDMRIILDCWLGYEYDDNSLGNAEFNQIYYGNRQLLGQILPSQKRKGELKRLLRRAKTIITTSYPECKPLNKLIEKFDQVLKAIDEWPATAKPPSYSKMKISAGTFVKLKSNNKMALLFHHNNHSQVIQAYNDAGAFMAARQEIAILKAQPSIHDFKPMRIYLPYGKWTQADGTEILFNRDYCPIWKRLATGQVADIQPDIDIDYEQSEFYYNDRSAPYYNNSETLQLCLSVLKKWGVENKTSQLMNLIPAALEAGDSSLLSPKGTS